MKDDPDRPVVLATVTTEAEAALLVAALETRGVRARFEGELTSGFVAAAPGEVRVIVRAADADHAREILQALEDEQR